MIIINKENRLCECCMTEHEVRLIRTRECNMFKGVTIEYDAEYYYCSLAEEVYQDEQLMRKNDIAMKDAYRKAMGLLTSQEIVSIRLKYGISQSDLCLLLGWGGKTVARYEGHQVQDTAHDTILRRLANDPEWFLFLLKRSKNLLSTASYSKYLEAGTVLFEQDHDLYLECAINAKYARYANNDEYTGGRTLSLATVVDMIRYFANSRQVLCL